MTLYEMTKEVADLYDLLSSNDEIDEETKEKILKDTVEGMGVEEKLEAYCVVYRQLMADVKMLDTEAARLKKRQKSLENNVKRLSDMVLMYMKTTGEEEKDVGIFKVKVGKSQKTEVFDMAKLPKEFIKTKTDSDNAAIRKLLIKGIDVPGARLNVLETIKID